jgi:hypothetical protein
MALPRQTQALARTPASLMREISVRNTPNREDKENTSAHLFGRLLLRLVFAA